MVGEFTLAGDKKQKLTKNTVDMSPLGLQSLTHSRVPLTETSAQKHDTLRYGINVQLLHK